ncbi:MAG: helix-turn-helix transcriptional regulator [Chloroflexota bacterium]
MASSRELIETKVAVQTDPNGFQQKLHQFNSWAAQLKHHIKTKKIRQCDLAEKIPVAPSTLSQWCNESRFPDTNSVYLLSKALDLSPEENVLFVQAWRDTNAIKDFTNTIQLALDNGDFDYIKTIFASLSNDAVQQIYGH